MRKIGFIAAREFFATVATRGFLFGVLLLPAILTVAISIGPRLMNQRSAPVRGQVAVLDPTGSVTPELRATIDAQAIATRRADAARRAIANAPAAVRDLAGNANAGTSNTVVDTALGVIPELQIVDLPNGGQTPADLQSGKAWLTDVTDGPRHVALIVVHADAVERSAGRADYGTYDLYVPQNLDDRVETAIYDSLREAIVNARVRKQSLDRNTLDATLRVPRTQSIGLTRNGERPTVGAFNRLMPFGFVFLLFFTVLMGGQGLVTSTVEEKSSRVIEVLLSAVSPFELMAGKILGQMCVSLVVLALYIGLALLLLVSFTLLGLLDFSLVFYLVVFFIITYLTMGSLMAAVGAAVNEMREAQSLMMPITFTMMLPYLLWVPITTQPNSTFSTVISFVPGVNTFAMLLRLTSSAPPPAWQVWLTIAIGIGSVGAAVWVAAKVFRVGLLLHGKPPDFATLARWVRAA